MIRGAQGTFSEDDNHEQAFPKISPYLYDRKAYGQNDVNPHE